MRQALKSGVLAVALLAMHGASGIATAAIPSTEPPEAPGGADVEAAQNALDGFDYARLWSESGYAEEMLRHADTMMPLVSGDYLATAGLTGLRALILAALDRGDESRRAVRTVITSGVREPEPYVMAWAAAADLWDPDLMLGTVKAIARDVTPASRPATFDALTPEVMWPLIHHFREQKQDEQHHGLVEALVGLGWPGDDPAAGDALRMRLVDHRLEQGNRAAAAELARTVIAPDAFLPLILMRKYDGLLDGALISPDHFTRLLEEHDAQTERALADAPEDYDKVLSRAQFLRGRGREAEAASLLERFYMDVPATHAAGEQGMWIINEAAYALLALGKHEDALRPMSQLVELDMAASPGLIGPSINYAEMLRRAGRPKESLAHVERLASLAQYANAYGEMWIMAAAVCSLADLSRMDEAKARLREMEKRPTDNPAALMRSLLCLDALDAAEKLAVERLRSEDPKDMILAFQDYLPGGANSGADTTLYERLLQLRERPAVAAALDKIARRMNLPLARTYYGGV